MSAHTPGPWRVTAGRIIVQDAGVIIGSAAGHPNSGFYPTEEEGVANARLIAAAPDLLAVLQKIRDYHVNHHVLFEIDAVIARATGAAA